MLSKNRSFITPVSSVRFFTLTLVLSWLIWIPLALSHFGIAFNISESTSAIVRLLGVLMPAISALYLTAVSGEIGEVRRMLSRLTHWRVGWKWWGAAVLFFPVLLAASALIYNSFGEPNVTLIQQKFPTLIVNILFLLIAVLGEEIGWHGVALPALQQKHNPQVSSLILGLFMGVWHLPFWLLLDTYDQYGLLYLALNFMFVLPVAFYVTWFFNHSGYSLLLPVTFHLVFNIVNTALLPVTLNLGAFGLLLIFSWITMILVLPLLTPKKL